MASAIACEQILPLRPTGQLAAIFSKHRRTEVEPRLIDARGTFDCSDQYRALPFSCLHCMRLKQFLGLPIDLTTAKLDQKAAVKGRGWFCA